MLENPKQRLAAALDRPGRRHILRPLATLYASARNRSLVRVADEADLWVHHHGAGKLVFRGIYTISPKQLDEITRDTFFYTYTPRRGDVVVDVGAGVGTETLTLSRLVGGTGRVIAIEAHPETYRCLAKLCELNALDNVSPRQLAIMDKSGPVTLSDVETDISNTVMRETADAISVPGVSLDELAETEQLQRIDFLKMNIEGAEAPALQGMRRTLGMTHHLAISCHDFIADASGDESMRTKAIVRKALEAHGFSITERPSDARRWVRDTLYGTRSSEPTS
jgi:FkbM family methyltransferase